MSDGIKDARNKRLDELEEVPGHIHLTYSVCGVSEDSCGWEGWIIEDLRVDERERQGSAKTEVERREIFVGVLLGNDRKIGKKDHGHQNQNLLKRVETKSTGRVFLPQSFSDRFQ